MSFPVYFGRSIIASNYMQAVDDLHSLEEYHGIICIILDDDGTVIFGNRRFDSLFQNSTGGKFVKLLHASSISKWLDLIVKCVETPNTLFKSDVLAMCTGHVYERLVFEIYFQEGKFGIVGYKSIDMAGNFESLSLYQERMREIAFMQNHGLRAPVARILGVSSLSIISNDIGELKNYALLMRKDAEQLDEFIKKITALTHVSNG
jgi:hypothetical protein